MTVHELFDSLQISGIQYNEDLIFDREKLTEFVENAAMRDDPSEGIPLAMTGKSLLRHSVRNFKHDIMVGQSDLSAFLEVLRLIHEPDCFHQNHQFSYPSAGGLYPIDVYLYVKKDRVEGLKEGIYFYSRMRHELVLKSEQVVSWKAHYYNNREIFKGSAFSVFFFYNPQFSFPKYGGMGLFYGILDCGIILELLEQRMPDTHLGGCIIGDLDYRKLNVNADQNLIYICCMEVGYPEERINE